MRALFAATVGLGFLVTACGNSTTQSSGTTSSGLMGVADSGMPPGAACTYNTACASGICDLNGAGNCCLVACTVGDKICGATGCDSSGLCIYPQPGIDCGSSCTMATVTPANCDGSGNCSVQNPMLCPNNFGCDSDGGCASSCGSSADCASGFVCNGGSCGAPIQTGICTENDACKSGICGVAGSGNCCARACLTADPTCGASGCTFDAGTCVYPPNTTNCGPAESCATGIQTNPTVCNGSGTCPTAQTIQCDPYVCGANACLTTCTSNADCVQGDFCDNAHTTCCGGLTNLSNMAVDAVTGSDAACCGIQGKNPCQTISYAMKLIDAAGAQNVTIKASVNGNGGGNWAGSGTETYPIVLGWGVELQAPGVYFVDSTGGNSSIFDIKAYSANDNVASASIAGTSGNPVRIGFNTGAVQSTDSQAIKVEGGSSLYLAGATINGSATLKTPALSISANASLILGQDAFGDVNGVVTIGNNLGKSVTDGWDGIVCASANGKGCTITDVNIGGPSVVIMGQEDHDIDAEDYAAITLNSAPTIGVAPSTTGFNKCGTKLDAAAHSDYAILLKGAVTMTLDDATVQCIAGDGIDMLATANGTPTLNMTKTTIQNTQWALHAFAGTATISKSTIQYNFNGVAQDTDGTNIATVDLSGGKIGGTNTVACANNIENSDGGTSAPGVSVLNTTSAKLNAADVDWDTATPDLFMCNSALASCVCESGTCATTPGTNGMDAVYESTGLVTTTGNGLSTLNCSPYNCGTINCTNGEVCCNNEGYSNCNYCVPASETYLCEDYGCGGGSCGCDCGF